jgi:hypothetical protein
MTEINKERKRERNKQERKERLKGMKVQMKETKKGRK